MTGQIVMDRVGCSSGAVTERPDLTAQGYRRFRCRDCDQQFNERSDGGSTTIQSAASRFGEYYRIVRQAIGIFNIAPAGTGATPRWRRVSAGAARV
jgi:hypothetical protein